MRPITLTTDFGLTDWFVGTMKGVIASIAPEIRVIDITHGIEPGDIVGGAFALAAATKFFPEGTIHVAVVDPGVGSARLAVAAQCSGQIFVAPDNGLLSLVVPEGAGDVRIHRIENERLFLHPVSRTFHGRDVFAPVAAHLSRGLPLSEVGSPTSTIVRLALPGKRETTDGFLGEVVYVDRFGNAITSISETSRACRVVELADGTRMPVAGCYADVPVGAPVAIFGSSGRLEIAINGGDAARTLGLRRGTRIVAK